jgi:4'-phosphopantetheinyl transferase
MTRLAIDVWRLRLDLPGSVLARLFETLAPDERARAFRFQNEGERARFVAARGQLRAILGESLARAPDSLVFANGVAGKPRLEHPRCDGTRALRFSLSHSDDAMLVAVARGVEVGIDIERRRALAVDPLALARAAFAPAELGRLSWLQGSEREESFCRLWVRREAVLKALGIGLRAPDGIEVSEGLVPRLLRLADGSDPSAWTIRDLDCGPGFAAALAAPAEEIALAHRRLDLVRRPRGPKCSYPHSTNLDAGGRMVVSP